MQFNVLKNTLLDIINELELNKNIQDTIQMEIDGKNINPSDELDLLHAKLKEKNLNDKIVKNILINSNFKILCGHAAILDYYLIFLGFTIPIGGFAWLNDDDIMFWYKSKIHSTNYGRIAIKHKFGSIYNFKVKVAEVCENWLFSKWNLFPDHDLKADDLLRLKKQISVIKNARLVIDINMLKKIFEFNAKDFFYDTKVIDFLSGYNFDIKKFETHLVENIEIIGCEYRRRLDDCYELIFS